MTERKIDYWGAQEPWANVVGECRSGNNSAWEAYNQMQQVAECVSMAELQTSLEGSDDEVIFQLYDRRGHLTLLRSQGKKLRVVTVINNEVVSFVSERDVFGMKLKEVNTPDRSLTQNVHQACERSHWLSDRSRDVEQARKWIGFTV